jgi:hypothetical protein
MNKGILITAVLVITNSCIRDVYQRYTDYHYITNTTGKPIIHELIGPSNYSSYGIEKDTFQFYSSGLVNTPELEWKISGVVGVKREHIPAVIAYKSFNTYNIQDTTSLHWKYFLGGYDEPNIKYPQYIYDEYGGQTCTDTECNKVLNYYLIVNDSLLLLMQKDYTMLDKFKEYYAHE